MIDDYKSGIACALGAAGVLLVEHDGHGAGILFLALLLVAFWRPMVKIAAEVSEELRAWRKARRDRQRMAMMRELVSEGAVTVNELRKEVADANHPRPRASLSGSRAGCSAAARASR